jgi:hypothetical protein
MSMWLERLTKPSPTNEPPTARELRRNDLLVAGVILFALVLAFGIRNQVLNASKSVRLGEDLPRIAYPERWRARSTDGVLLHAVNAGSPSTFDSQLLVTARPLRTDETMETARAARGIGQAAELDGYRELSAERMTVYGDQPALVTTYAYIADPTRDMGAIGLPVVVEAQDIMFLHDGQIVVVTLAADAGAWEEEANEFAVITNSLRLQPIDERDAVRVAPAPDTAPGVETPAADAEGTIVPAEDAAEAPAPTPAAQESGFGGAQAGAPGAETGNEQAEGDN